MSRRPSPSRLKAERGGEDRDTRRRWHPPLVQDEPPPRRNHRPPFRRGRLRAHAEEAQCCGSEDDRAHVQRHPHDEAGNAERRHVPKHDAPGGRPGQTGRGDEVGVAEPHRFSPCQPGVGRPGRERDGGDGGRDAGPQSRYEGEGQNEPGEGERKMSVTRISTRSQTPPAYPATQPTARPSGATSTTTATTMPSVIRPP